MDPVKCKLTHCDEHGKITIPVKSKYAMCSKKLNKIGFEPSTGLGIFNADYCPGLLTITVFVTYSFEPGHQRWSEEDEESKKKWKPAYWTAKEKHLWAERFVHSIETRWSYQHIFRNDKKELAEVKIKILSIKSGSHWMLHVAKVIGFCRSSVDKGEHRPCLFDSGDVELGTVASSYWTDDSVRITSIHEFGHMIGLGDEYLDKKSNRKDGDDVRHTKLASKLFPNFVCKAHDGNSVMSRGSVIGPEHYVTFLEALISITNDPSWRIIPSVSAPPDPQDRVINEVWIKD